MYNNFRNLANLDKCFSEDGVVFMNFKTALLCVSPSGP